MADVIHQICLYDQTVCDGEKRFALQRGKEYITTRPKKGLVTVLSSYWVSNIPAKWFGGPLDDKLQGGDGDGPEARDMR